MTSTRPDTPDTATDAATPPGATGSTASATSPVWRAEAWRYVELLAVCGLAIAQPLLDLYGHNAEEFVTRNSSTSEIVLFGLTLVLVPPAVLFVLTVPLRLISERVELIVHRVLLAGILGITVVQMFSAQPATTKWALGILGAVGMGFLLFRFAATRTWIRYLSAAPALFLAAFLFASSVTPVMFDSGPSGESALAVEVDNPIPVVFLLLDELPTASLMDGTGKIDASLYPNFARLAAGSTWYPDTSTVAPNTPTAVPAIMTGSYPGDGAAIASEYPNSIYTLLGGTYDMNVQETITDLCPKDLCTRFSQGASSSLTGLLSSAAGNWEDRLTGEQPTEETRVRLSQFIESADGVAFHDPVRLTTWMDSLNSDGTPRLNLLHSVLPHYPWEYTPLGYRYDAERFTKFEGLAFHWSSPESAESAHRRHLLQLQYLDSWLGAIIDRLEETGLWDDALIVVTADHGVSFQATEPIRGTSDANAWEIMWVPFFVRAPGLPAGVVDDRAVSSVDILPTIADVLGIELPFETDGVSALVADPEPQPERFMHENPMNTLATDDSGYGVVPAAPNLQKVLTAPRSGSGTDDLRLWRTGTYANLVGTSPDQYTQGETFGAAVEVEDPGASPVFDIDSATAPVEVVTRLPAGLPGRQIAVVLNGTIVTVSTFSSVNAAFWTLLPDSRLAQGTNYLQFYAVDGDPAAPTLYPLPTA